MSGAQTLTIADFLLARIAEDEADAMAGWRWKSSLPAGEYERLQGRVLAECGAKRRLVRALQAADEDSGVSHEYGFGLHLAVQTFAAIYANHPDYREEWRP